MRTSIKGVNSPLVAKALSAKHKLHCFGFFTHSANDSVGRFIEERDIDIPPWKEIFDEFLLIDGKAICLSILQAGKAPTERLPQRRGAIGVERGEEFGQDALAKAFSISSNVLKTRPGK
tara:strand:+ start:2381 stop:2737 length:357 start_codon:yes stop_codon:yes gene_type:complete